ncbi:MAG: isoprenylcysteine carboxylmethyltransferase family protein [Desulfarculaceae bacterium]|jgi:protein-S-isoprenylcysteine O-methyltransferase Ste14
MKNKHFMDSFFLSNPFYRGMFELVVLVGTGICGLVFSWAKFDIAPVSNIFGGLLIVLALVFHGWTEKYHKQAHEHSADIDNVVTTGVYAKIRHPLYLSLIVQNMGIALVFGVVITYFLALLTIIHWVVTALREEAALTERLGQEYIQYKQNVRWRLIPGVF